MCFFGQSVVFEDASSLINSLTGGGFNAKQVERVCHLYGGLGCPLIRVHSIGRNQILFRDAKGGAALCNDRWRHVPDKIKGRALERSKTGQVV
uniref:hypothetical protein n=1 Tax=Mariniflexile sp. TaxID=1979402 RepID=UPI004047255B